MSPPPSSIPKHGEPILLPDGTQASRAIDGTETRGFELEVAGELRAGWNASLGWSRYQIEDADGHAVRTFVPRTLIRGFTTWTPDSASKADTRRWRQLAITEQDHSRRT